MVLVRGLSTKPCGIEEPLATQAIFAALTYQYISPSFLQALIARRRDKRRL
jgi:hypothetical protein